MVSKAVACGSGSPWIEEEAVPSWSSAIVGFPTVGLLRGSDWNCVP